MWICCVHFSQMFFKNDKIYQFYTNLQAILKIKYKFGSRKWDIIPEAASTTNFPVKHEISYRDLYQFIEILPKAIWIIYHVSEHIKARRNLFIFCEPQFADKFPLALPLNIVLRFYQLLSSKVILLCLNNTNIKWSAIDIKNDNLQNNSWHLKRTNPVTSHWRTKRKRSNYCYKLGALCPQFKEIYK